MNLIIKELFDHLQLSFKQRSLVTYELRQHYLKKLEQEILNRQEEIQVALYSDLHKSAFEADATEIFTVITELRHTCAHLHQWMRHNPVSTPITLLGTSSYMIPEPKGVVLIIAPWNYPFNLCIGPLISAIAAGNMVIIKPSELANETSRIIKSIINNVFPKNIVEVVEGDASVATDLLQLPFNHIFYTGSGSIAKIILRAAAENLTPVTLELGGKSPAIIDQNFSLKVAAERIAFAKYLNAGQTCIAPDFILIPENNVNDFIKFFNQKILEFYEGKNLAESNYCSIINIKHFNRIRQLWTDATQYEAISQSLEYDETCLKIKPSCLVIKDFKNPIMASEIFGPLLPVIAYRSKEDIINPLKSMDRPLNLYIFSEDKPFTNYILQNTRSGGVSINQCLINYCNPNLPFGGDGPSGMGQSHGVFGFNAFSHFRSVAKQSILPTGLLLFTPPYNNWKTKIKNFLIKYI